MQEKQCEIEAFQKRFPVYAIGVRKNLDHLKLRTTIIMSYELAHTYAVDGAVDQSRKRKAMGKYYEVTSRVWPAKSFGLLMGMGN